MQTHFDIVDLNLHGDRKISGTATLGFNASGTEKQFSVQLGIWATPTLLFLNEAGQVALRLNGYDDLDKFMTAMRYIAEKQETQMSFGKFLERSHPPSSSEELIQEDFFAAPPHNLNAGTLKKPVVVLFEESNSEASRHLHKEVLQTPDTLKQLQAFHVVQLNRWSDTPLITPDGIGQTAKNWAETLRLNALPCLLLFDQGREILRLDAMFKAFHVQSLLDYVASGAYHEELDVQRYLHKRSERLREQGITVNLWH
ncbi:Thioredoxin domain-containing protein [Gammaproteobacteria bacterium]